MSAPAELLQRFARRDRRALARILSLVENAADLPPPPAPASRATVAGIAGSGGSGKSTLIQALIEHLRQQRQRVAVLACDPQSPRTGGALLGDRVRARFDPADEGVYFRSLSTRGAPGGISAAVAPAVAWLRAFGFDAILVETVGIGQDQVAIREVVDRLVLVVTPQSGDEVQWEKAGLIELADVIVVNKADLSGAERVAGELRRALSLGGIQWAPPVLCTTAVKGEGTAELWEAIARLPDRKTERRDPIGGERGSNY